MLASSGSVVPIFRRQIERGGPVTVTHPEMTRYFTTIPEAVQLVIRAGDIGAGKGEVFVLDMGEPVKILDLADNMIRLAGYEPEADIAIEFTQPRPGEKLHEELFGRGESVQPTAARRIRRAVRQEPFDAEWVESTLNSLEHLVLAGDEANLAENASSAMIAAPGGDAATVVRDEQPSAATCSKSSKTSALSLDLLRFFGVAVLALLSFTQGRDIRRLRDWAGSAPERDAERKESTSAAAAERAEEMRRLEEARTEEREAAELRETRRERREAGLPELTRSERLRMALSTEDRSPLAYVAAFLAVVVVVGGVAYAVTGGFGGDDGKSGGGKHSKGLHPAEIEVAVLNGTATEGLAGEYGDMVESRGFQLGNVTNTESAQELSAVMFKPNNGRAAQKVAKSLEHPEGAADDRRSRPARGRRAGRGRGRRGQCLGGRLARRHETAHQRRRGRLRDPRPRHRRRLRLVPAVEAGPAGPRQGHLRRRSGPPPEAPGLYSFTPNGDCRYDVIRIRFRVTQSDDAVVQIVKPGGKLVVTLARDRFLKRYHFFTFYWDGRSREKGGAPPAATSCGSSCLNQDRVLVPPGAIGLHRAPAQAAEGLQRGPMSDVLAGVGVLAAAGAAAAAILLPAGRRALGAMLAALVLFPALILGDQWHSHQIVDLRDDSTRFAALGPPGPRDLGRPGRRLPPLADPLAPRRSSRRSPSASRSTPAETRRTSSSRCIS